MDSEINKMCQQKITTVMLGPVLNKDSSAKRVVIQGFRIGGGMRKQLYWLSDEEWQRIEPLLPRGRRGARRVDDRRVISGIVHMLRSGARWRDCPPEYGPYTTIYNPQSLEPSGHLAGHV